LTHRAGEELAERNELHSMAGACGVLLVDAAHDAGNVGLRLRKRDAGLETADDIEIVRFAVSANFALPVGEGAKDFRNNVDGVDPELNVVAIAEAGGKDSDDLHGLIIEGDGFADDRAVASEMALPEAVSEYCDARGAESSFGREKDAPENGLNAEKRENGSRSDHSWDPFGRAESSEIEAQAVNRGNFGEGTVLRLEIEEVGGREGSFGKMGLRLPEPNEFVGRRIGERTHKDGVDHAEDGGVGTNAESKGEDSDKGEATTTEEYTQAEANILKDVEHG